MGKHNDPYEYYLRFGDKPYVFLAMPVSRYDSTASFYAENLARDIYGINVLDPALMPKTLQSSQWNSLVMNAKVLVFISDRDGCIGMGTYRNIVVAKQRGLPIYYYHEGKLLQGGKLRKCNNGGWVQYAKVILPRKTWLDKLNEKLEKFNKHLCQLNLRLKTRRQQ